MSAEQTSIQSRGEQKARKAILALGLKPVAGVNRVTFTRGRGVSLFFF
jgi:nascent polypeptide-associated complex subunit alpha